MTHFLCLSGKNHPLHFTVNALCSLEEKTGTSLDQLQGASLSCIRGLMWCALLQENPALTLSDAGSLLEAHLKSGGSLREVAASLAQALEDACFFHPEGQAAGMSP